MTGAPYSVGGPDGEQVSAIGYDPAKPFPTSRRSLVLTMAIVDDRTGAIVLRPEVYGPQRIRNTLEGPCLWDGTGYRAVAPDRFELIEGDHDGAYCPLPGMVELARFEGHPTEDFRGLVLLQAWCEATGLSLGSPQRGAPIGVVLEKGVPISKWSNLGPDRDRLDGCACWAYGTERRGTAVLFVRAELIDALRGALEPLEPLA